MKNLSVKLEREMKPESYILSNVFPFPGWKALNSSANGTFADEVERNAFTEFYPAVE